MSKSRARLNSEGMSDEGQKLLAFLLKNIKGQDSAVKDIVEADELFRSGLYANDRPIYSALLLGPSGVGKTLTAEVLAEYWFGSRSAFTKVSCETMSESHGIASLVGSPPGYVGFNNPNDPEHPGVEPILAQRRIDEPDFLSNPEVREAEEEIRKLFEEVCDIDDEIEQRTLIIRNAKEYFNRLNELQAEKDQVSAEIRKIEAGTVSSGDEAANVKNEIARISERASQIEAETKELHLYMKKVKESIVRINELNAEKIKTQLMIKGLEAKADYVPGKYRSIILFDEIEKGNETLHNLLLNIIDKGQLTLKNGMTTDFTKSIILMTSNIGSKEIASLLDNKKKIGFASEGSGNEDLNRNIYRHAEKAARNYFRPELLGRLNRISVFRPLNEEVIRMILESELARFQESILKSFPVAIRIHEDVKQFILREAMDRQQEGARLLRHKIDSYLREPFSRLKLRGEIQVEKDTLEVVLENGKIVFYRQ